MTADHAREAYDRMAPIYDDFNRQNDYRVWFDALLPRLAQLGLPESGRLLDVACGTGKAAGEMLARGWEVTACDISPAMVDVAARKHPEGIRFDVRDMRRLPPYEADGFDLVWALNDPVNYLIDDGDLRLALGSMGRNLSRGGLLVFDLNTLALFRSSFSEGLHRGDRWNWGARGQVDGIWEAELSGEGVEPHVHRERHYPAPEVQREMLNAGLEPVAAMGQREDGGGLVISDGWDEEGDAKIIHVARLSR